MRAIQRGQALTEYTALLGILMLALWWPLAGDRPAIEQLSNALTGFWQAWRAALLTAGAAP